ncbi:type II toxin-antitoxin system VapC family toxin [Agrobacterium vitis]|uniref:type II toxin-antitoxin system VapC family toxin n=1 Tax=Rhizobium/Agrobacterium group TaxID=227290 RepID=UPI0008DBF561|nr:MULTISPECIES: type II toxin-antitoxin system VapC family toxin [Rhizobium/Agrobacterium group]MCF1433199.1 type II toxin-antitoxin system VapC family toxin [Allorhizobium ampelinum]MUO91734.1 type II toxin-antitoxin system VapC family toxin [Agrobacterium vitis]MUZ54765.1 type II toxin-antitoxin system VapC family toxin [Agrobacterium vitis]MUZ93037.1 type II toxin-antitoxin system VapC family toxin [Agrobacterium vitis]MVA41441.1 type II toxin-antitoxin system VapC family toxin [Agrobacter
MLLDTSVLSEARRSEPIEEVVDFFRSLPDESIAIPMLSVFELERGARSLMTKDRERGTLYLEWLSELITKDIYFPPMTVEVFRLIARMAAFPPFHSYWRNDGPSKKLRFGCDPAIAAVSIIHGIPIATLDIRDFMRIHEFFPLPGLYDPVHRIWHVKSDKPPSAEHDPPRANSVLFPYGMRANRCAGLRETYAFDRIHSWHGLPLIA